MNGHVEQGEHQESNNEIQSNNTETEQLNHAIFCNSGEKLAIEKINGDEVHHATSIENLQHSFINIEKGQEGESSMKHIKSEPSKIFDNEFSQIINSKSEEYSPKLSEESKEKFISTSGEEFQEEINGKSSGKQEDAQSKCERTNEVEFAKREKTEDFIKVPNEKSLTKTTEVEWKPPDFSDVKSSHMKYGTENDINEKSTLGATYLTEDLIKVPNDIFLEKATEVEWKPQDILYVEASYMKCGIKKEIVDKGSLSSTYPTEDLIKVPNERFLERTTSIELKPQEIFYVESSCMNIGVENEFSEKPPLTSKEESSEKKVTIYDIVGSDGLWQRCIFSWKFCFSWICAFHYMIMTFLAPDVDYWCADSMGVNHTINEWKINGLPVDNRCSRYAYNTNQSSAENFTFTANNVGSCEAWEYDKSFYKSTIISEWNLVCEREWLSSLSLSIFNIGTMISSLAIGYFADIMGRKRIIITSIALVVLSATGTAFSRSYAMFVVTRFLTACGLSGVYNVSYVLMLEITGPKERAFYGVAMSFGWCFGFMSIPGIAWLARDWFWIEISITAPCVLLLLFSWVLTESPSWLIAKGRTEEAGKILIRSAKMNGRKISDLDVKLKRVMENAQKVNKPAEANHGFLDFVRSHSYWMNVLILWFIWFVTSFIFYGLSYNTNVLAGDPFINFSAYGGVEAIGYSFALFVVQYLSRKKPLCITMLIGGVACLSMYLLPKDPWWLSTAFSNIGKCSVTVASSVLCIYTAEIFPIVVRNSGVGISFFFSRLGAILAPFVKELGNATHPVVPQMVFGALSCLAGILVVFLPETKVSNDQETSGTAVTRTTLIDV